MPMTFVTLSAFMLVDIYTSVKLNISVYFYNIFVVSYRMGVSGVVLVLLLDYCLCRVCLAQSKYVIKYRY